MALFLSQIEPVIKHELYRRINLSSHGYSATAANVLDMVKTDESRHWYSRRKPWIRITSGALVREGKNGAADPIGRQYSEKAAMENILFGGILDASVTYKEATSTNKAAEYNVSIYDFKPTGLRDGFDSYYSGKRKVPRAGVTGITIANKGDLGSIREAEFKWTCWDKDEFSRLQRLYMTPGITCLVEWGWSLKSTGEPVVMDSKFFDVNSVSMGEKPSPYAPKAIREQVLKSDGCYDACVGMINNFDWTFNKESGAYDCTTKLTAPGDSLLGMDLNRGVESTDIALTESSSKWFTASSFKPYISGNGIRLSRSWKSGALFGKDHRIKVSSDLFNLTRQKEGATTDKVCWVGNMLNATYNSTGITLNSQEGKDILKGSSAWVTNSAAANVRVMTLPEISRTNGWSWKTGTETEFLKSINNLCKVTGAYWLDKWGPKNSTFITWAFLEEILINQFFCPKVGEKGNIVSGNIMSLRSCNTVTTETVADRNFYKAMCEKNGWMDLAKVLLTENSTFYESVRIGYHKDLISTDGNVMYIPNYPPPPINASSFDKFVVNEVANNPSPAKDKHEGYLRNLLINLEAVTASFKDAGTLEDGIKSLLGKINEASSDYWKLVLQCDEDDGGTSLKVIDANWVEKSMKDLMANKSQDQALDVNDVTFKFPIYSNNSISSGVTMSSKLPDSMKNAIFIGGSRYDNEHQSGAAAGGKPVTEKLTEDVIDRFYHFGEYEVKVEDTEQKAEAETRKGLKEKQELEQLEEANADIASAGMSTVLDSNAKDRIRRLLLMNDITDQDTATYNQMSNNRLLPVDLSLSLDGISGIYFGNVFTVSKLPEGLADRLLFQVKSVKHTVNNDTWTTDIEALCRIGDPKDSPGNEEDQEELLRASQTTMDTHSSKKYEASEHRMKEKKRIKENAESAAKAEAESSGSTDAVDKGNDKSAEVGAESGGTDPLNLDKDVNKGKITKAGVTIEINQGDSKSTDRKDDLGINTHIVEDMVGMGSPPQEIPGQTPAQIEEAAEELQATNIRTAWFDKNNWPDGSRSTTAEVVFGEAANNITMINEADRNAMFNHSSPRTPPENNTSHTEIVKAGYDLANAFDGYTSDNDMKIVIDILALHRNNKSLLMVLQQFTLWIINHYEQKDYDGDIFQWILYEVKENPGKGTSNRKFKDRLAEILDGVNYHFIGYRQLSAENLVNKKIDGVPSIEKTVSSGRMYSSYNTAGRPGYPWGPAVAGEEPGFYWMNTGELSSY